MALLTPQRISKVGITNISSALVAADTAGDSVISASGLVIVMENADSGSHTLTVAAPVATKDCGNLGALAVAPVTLAVAAGGIGAVTIPAGYSSQSLFEWTYDAVTDVTIGVFVANA